MAPPENLPSSGFISAKDIRDMHARRRQLQQRGIDVVVDRAYNRIRRTLGVNAHATSCMIEVPEFVVGHPLYDMGDCIVFVKRHLEASGFRVMYVFPRLLVVSWGHAVEGARALPGPAHLATFDFKPSGKVVMSLT